LILLTQGSLVRITLGSEDQGEGYNGDGGH